MPHFKSKDNPYFVFFQLATSYADLKNSSGI